MNLGHTTKFYTVTFSLIFFVSLTCESSGRCFIVIGLFWRVPVSGPPSDLLQSWGGECDGHVYGTWAGVVVWATVDCIVMLMQTHALSIARVCVIDLYIVLSAGKLGVKCSVAKHMVSFSIVCRWERIYNMLCPLYVKACRNVINQPDRWLI